MSIPHKFSDQARALQAAVDKARRLKESLGDWPRMQFPAVPGECDKGDNCDQCRNARKNNPQLQAFLKASWAADAAYDAARSPQYFESSMSSTDQFPDEQWESLYSTALEQAASVYTVKAAIVAAYLKQYPAVHFDD